MKDVIFRCTTLLLSLAFAGAPVAADYCAALCEATHAGATAASPDHAGHHHHSTLTLTGLSSIGQPPQPCGHDHNGIVGVARADDRASVRAPAPGAAVMPTLPVVHSMWISIRVAHGSSSPPGTSLREFASPLRV
jgi:hypothetical protein